MILADVESFIDKGVFGGSDGPELRWLPYWLLLNLGCDQWNWWSISRFCRFWVFSKYCRLGRGIGWWWSGKGQVNSDCEIDTAIWDTWGLASLQTCSPFLAKKGENIFTFCSDGVTVDGLLEQLARNELWMYQTWELCSSNHFGKGWSAWHCLNLR